MKSATARGLLGAPLRREGEFVLHHFLSNDGTNAVAWVADSPRLAHEAMLRSLELRSLGIQDLELPTISERGPDGTRMRVDLPCEGQLLSNVASLPRGEAVRLVTKTLGILKALHAGNMVHGNVQAEGIYLGPGLRLGLTAPVLRAHHGPPDLPERLDKLLPDASTDIWGLGQVLGQLLGPLPRRDPLRALIREMTEWMPEDRLVDHDEIERRLEQGAAWQDETGGFWSRLLRA